MMYPEMFSYRWTRFWSNIEVQKYKSYTDINPYRWRKFWELLDNDLKCAETVNELLMFSRVVLNI